MNRLQTAYSMLDCRDVISRMLVTDPKRRAPLSEIMTHPWMTKGFHGPPENYLPHREPLTLPLDAKVIDKMTGFEFGSADFIRNQLESVIQSEEYQRAIRLSQKKAVTSHSGEGHSKRSSVFDFYQRRRSNNSKDALSNSSTEALQLGDDPVNAFSPLISIYYLVREKQEREKQESNPGALSVPMDQPLALPVNAVPLAPPQAAVTNPSSYEMKGEAPTGGRARPRARTHGEDEITEAVPPATKPSATPQMATPIINEPATRTNQLKKEGTAAGLLRRLSTRRNRDSDVVKDEKPRSSQSAAGPSVAVQSPPEGAMNAQRSSFTVRKQRDQPPSAYRDVAEKHPELLAPPGSSDGSPRKLRGLGRSASVNSGDVRRRWSLRRGPSDNDSSKTSGYESEKSSISEHRSRHSDIASIDPDKQSKRLSFMGRTRSVDHSRRQSVQDRRSLRIDRQQHRESALPEETDAELIAEQRTGRLHAVESQEALKPVYFKGLFSVSTTSSKPLSFIRSDIIRVLNQLGVDYTEMKNGFSCKHLPSIDLNKVKDQDASLDSSRPSTQVHRRKISFAGLRSSAHEADRSQGTPKPMSRGHEQDNSAEDSEDENADRRPRREDRAPGETTTHVHSDLGQSMILKFEILVVKVPIVSLHGIQFKKVDGGTWQYKRMAETILTELKL